MTMLNLFPRRPRWTYVVRTIVAVLVALLLRQLSAHGTLSLANNLFLTTDWLVMKCLDLLLNKLAITSYFNTDLTKEFEQDFPVSDTIRVKFPQRYTIRDGWEYQGQGINRQYTTVAVDQPFGVDFEWDTYERAVKMERSEESLEREYLEPAMAQIFQEIESRAALFGYQNTNNIVGVLGTDPTTFDASSAAARALLTNLGCPAGKDRGIMLPTSVIRALKNATATYFNPVTDITKMFREGIVGRADGFDFYESVSLYSHTAGTWAGAVTANGAGQSGSTLTINATAGDTFNKGDVFSLASVNPVNPMTRRKVGTSAKTFVVTQALVAAGGGVDVLQISPAIFGPGSQYQNVDALPGNSAALTLFPGTSSPNGKVGTQGLALHPNGFAMIGLPLENPKKEEQQAKHRDPDSGLELAFIRSFNAQSRKWINRFDIFIGFGRLYSDNCAVRILCA
jgi:hypothetical protein